MNGQLPYFAPMPLIASLTDPIVEVAVDVVDAMGLPGVFVLMVLESACIPVPSEATMLFAGFNVSRGEYSLLAATAVGSAREPGRARGSPTGSAAPAAWTSSRSTGRSCTSSSRTSSGRTAGSSATATPPSSSPGCCRSSGRSSRCPPASRGCRSGASASSRSWAACPWVLMLDLHRQGGRRQLGRVEGQPPLRRLRGRGGDRDRGRLARRPQPSPRPARRGLIRYLAALAKPPERTYCESKAGDTPCPSRAPFHPPASRPHPRTLA